MWEQSYGAIDSPTTAAALATISVPEQEPPASLAAEQSPNTTLSAGDLTDAALAWHLNHELESEVAPVLESNTSSTAEVSDQALEEFATQPQSVDLSADFLSVEADQDNQTEAIWLEDDLLESALG